MTSFTFRAACTVFLATFPFVGFTVYEPAAFDLTQMDPCECGKIFPILAA